MIRSRDSMMRLAPMRWIAFVIYRVTDIVALLFPLALIIGSAVAALYFNSLEDAGRLR
jgi:uncharacterized protein (DUF983 family)